MVGARIWHTRRLRIPMLDDALQPGRSLILQSRSENLHLIRPQHPVGHLRVVPLRQHAVKDGVFFAGGAITSKQLLIQRKE